MIDELIVRTFLLDSTKTDNEKGPYNLPFLELCWYFILIDLRKRDRPLAARAAFRNSRRRLQSG